MVLPGSDRVSRAPPYSGTIPRVRSLSLTRLSRSLVRLSSRLQLAIGFLTRAERFGSRMTALQHRSRNARMLTREWFRLFPFRSPLLRESRLLSFPPVPRWFRLPPFALSRLFVSSRSTYPLRHVGCPIRRSGDHRSLAAPPGLSQLAASFVACDA